jgi:hypothetical protein
MVDKILRMLSIRCSHKKISQPFAASATTGRRSSSSADWDTPAAASSHYVVCLDCGRKFDYDWSNMRMIGR